MYTYLTEIRMHKLVLALAALTILSACDNKVESQFLVIDPPSLRSCEVASEVTVKWDVRTKYPDIKDVSIYVSDRKKETLFAVGGAVGEAKTGNWAKPQIPIFIIKDRVSGKVLGESSVAGPVCK